ncbi:MAG: hypothetical protein KDC69_04305 [Flavobacteriaceae bacterium]|nr:hypothetical protein [Flavobacteriaceae bacterium]MCB0474872.1 hypothetical protein [Flavobacteriaceae bacterium]
MIRKITLLFIILLTAHTGFSQKNNTSPYSFFGIGEESADKTVEEMSMGETGVTYFNPIQLTFSNPASLAALQLTSYTLGVENKTLNINDGINKGTAASTSLSYLAMGIPLGTNGGFSFGLKPNTTVGYSLTEKISETETNYYDGEGGTNKVFLGFGYKIVKNFNIGLEGSYIFGKVTNSLYNSRDTVLLATVHKSESRVKGFALRAGIQYSSKLNDKIRLDLGGLVNLSSELTNEGNEYLFTNYDNASRAVNSSYARDTIVNNAFSGKITKPLKTTLGIGVGQENKWYATLEYSMQNPIEFTDGVLDKNTIVSYDKYNKLAFGFLYIPKINSISSYWQRIHYRAGIKLKQTGLVVNDNSINDFGMSFGVGLPIGKQLSSVNLGFELGKRGKINNGIIKENYFNLRLSLTLNDKWFKKTIYN